MKTDLTTSGYFDDLLNDDSDTLNEEESDQLVSQDLFSDGYFSDLLNEEPQEPQEPQEPEPTKILTFEDFQEMDRLEQEDADRVNSRRTGEGFWGGVGDVAAGVGSGTLRGIEQAYKAIEWITPSYGEQGKEAEEGAAGAAEFFKQIREEHPYLFGESLASESARQDSAWNMRGWINPAFESLGMLVPSAVSGLGIAGIGTQFWGGTAQEAYDETVATEAAGGKKLSETEKIIYANSRGAVEGGLEALQSYAGVKMGGILRKLFPKKQVGKLITGAIKKPGSPVVNLVKELTASVASEVPMELIQEYGGQKLQYEFGQSENDPGWEDIKAVIGPTIIMSVVLAGTGNFAETSEGKQLQKALSDGDAPIDARLVAVQKVYKSLAKDDPELAKFWLDSTKPMIEENKPIIVGENDAEFIDTVETGQLAEPQVGNDQLEVALQQEKARAVELEAMVKENTPAPTPETGETPAPTPAPEKGQPNAEGVIEVEELDNSRSVDQVDAQIESIQKSLKGLKKGDKRIPEFEAALEKVKNEKKNLIETQEKSPKTEETAKAPTEETAEVEPVKPGSHQQAAKLLEEMGAEKIVDGAETTWEIDTPDGRVSIKQDGNNAIEAHSQVQAALGEKQKEKVSPAVPEAQETAKPAEFSQPITRKNLKRNPETNRLVYTDPKTGAKLEIYNETKGDDSKSTGWYRVTPEGEHQFLGKTRKQALEAVNGNASAEDITVDKKPETQYSAKKGENDLFVDHDTIPDTIEVTIPTGEEENEQKKVPAKEALKSTEKLVDKLEKILDCVRS